MKTPKEKAIELFDRFKVEAFSEIKGWYIETEASKDMAKLVVDEIIEEVRDYCDTNFHQERMIFWQEVRFEIEKL